MVRGVYNTRPEMPATSAFIFFNCLAILRLITEGMCGYIHRGTGWRGTILILHGRVGWQIQGDNVPLRSISVEIQNDQMCFN